MRYKLLQIHVIPVHARIVCMFKAVGGERKVLGIGEETEEYVILILYIYIYIPPSIVFTYTTGEV